MNDKEVGMKAQALSIDILQLLAEKEKNNPNVALTALSIALAGICADLEIPDKTAITNFGRFLENARATQARLLQQVH